MTSLHERVQRLLNQLAVGLGYFDLPESYVPLVSMTFYKKEVLDPLFNDAQKIEENFNSFKTHIVTICRRPKTL
jgi:hypothetical protein